MWARVCRLEGTHESMAVRMDKNYETMTQLQLGLMTAWKDVFRCQEGEKLRVYVYPDRDHKMTGKKFTVHIYTFEALVCQPRSENLKKVPS
jgi:hypothetical protein